MYRNGPFLIFFLGLSFCCARSWRLNVCWSCCRSWCLIQCDWWDWTLPYHTASVWTRPLFNVQTGMSLWLQPELFECEHDWTTYFEPIYFIDMFDYNEHSHVPLNIFISWMYVSIVVYAGVCDRGSCSNWFVWLRPIAARLEWCGLTCWSGAWTCLQTCYILWHLYITSTKSPLGCSCAILSWDCCQRLPWL